MPNEGSRKKCIDRLLRDGVLMKSDARFPSVATLIAGEPVRGSWWSHPSAQTIFEVTDEISDRPDVVLVKLVSGKDTFVHRRLWPELLAIATSNEPWQAAKLPAAAKTLYRNVMKRGSVEVSGAAAKLLESRLLVRGYAFHSETGAHKNRLESWQSWSKAAGLSGRKLPTLARAKATFEKRYPGAAWPWSKPLTASASTLVYRG